jgi:hypothetical protein
MENGITDAPKMESLTEGIAWLFEEMVPSPSAEEHAFGAESQKYNASVDLREEIHDLIQKFEEKVRCGEYYEISVLK